MFNSLFTAFLLLQIRAVARGARRVARWQTSLWRVTRLVSWWRSVTVSKSGRAAKRILARMGSRSGPHATRTTGPSCTTLWRRTSTIFSQKSFWSRWLYVKYCILIYRNQRHYIGICQHVFNSTWSNHLVPSSGSSGVPSVINSTACSTFSWILI